MLERQRGLDLKIVHTGQHYDREMSAVFFRELQIPQPSANLNVGSGSHARQTALMMRRLEPLMIKAWPDVVLVPGDTNTTLAAAITAAKLCIPLAHLEAGLRSGDMNMPEEVNRRLTDHCSSLLFAPTKTAVSNLEREGLGESAYLTGDTNADALRMLMPVVARREKAIMNCHRLSSRNYVLVTLHRPSNVDDPARLTGIQTALREVSKTLKVVFPVHPRTRARLAELRTFKRETKKMSLLHPQGFIETLSLLKNASCLLTDSGGMQKESFMLHIPCITLRSTTEWPETMVGGANRLVANPEEVPKLIFDIAFDRSLRRRIKNLRSPFGDGHASARIAKILRS
jgi:UDP-N-acetylglucosamine 2-epimerase